MPGQQTAAAPADGALSLDQFVGVLDADAAKAAAPIDEEDDSAPAAEAGEAADEAVGDHEEAAEEENIEAADEDGEEEEAEPAPIPDPPQSWSKEDREGWAELSPKARETVLRRERERDAAIADVTTKTGRALAELQNISKDYERVAQTLTDDVERARQAWQKQWGGVHWPTVAQQHGLEQAQQWKLQADTEREQIETYAKQVDAEKAKAAKASEVARAAWLADEAKKLTELSPELADPKEGPARRAEVGKYLVAQGFAEETVRDVSALELSIARKAMLWDNAQKAAKAAANLPRKNPISTAKPMPAASAAGAAVASPKRDLQAASQRLTKTGSIDAFVGLLDAEEAARNRKVRR